MLIAPFSLHRPDGSFNLPQKLARDFADRPCEDARRLRGIELQHRREVLVGNMRPGIQPAARHRHIADAGLRRVPEPHPDGAFIILSEEGIVNVVKNLLPVLIPVRLRLLPGDAHQLRMKPDKAAHAVVFRHRRSP
ncbi:MAG: hypothetical protein ACI4PG_00290 [Candidatus Ventricola sp.]